MANFDFSHVAKEKENKLNKDKAWKKELALALDEIRSANAHVALSALRCNNQHLEEINSLYMPLSEAYDKAIEVIIPILAESEAE